MYKTFASSRIYYMAQGKTSAKVQSSPESENRPNPIDVHVGSRLRVVRKLKNCSQQKLAQILGLTFQQVQKYERADNRIGASRLYEIAQALGVHVSYFFEGYGKSPRTPVYAMAEDAANADLNEDIMQRSETLKLVSAYYQIKDDAMRKQMLDMIKTLAKK